MANETKMRKYFQYPILTVLGMSSMTFSACSGLVDIYDELTVQDTASSPYRQLHVTATTYDDWTYLTLDNPDSTVVLPIPTTLNSGEWDGVTSYTRQEIKLGSTTELSSTPTDAQPEPERWDLAFHHFDIRTNGGMAFETEYTSLDQLPAHWSDIPGIEWQADQTTKDRVWIDLSNSLAFNIGCQTIDISLPLSNMAWMDVSNPPPIYNVSGHVCLLRMKDGTVAALFLDNYMNEKGKKGYLTISYIYPYE